MQLCNWYVICLLFALINFKQNQNNSALYNVWLNSAKPELKDNEVNIDNPFMAIMYVLYISTLLLVQIAKMHTMQTLPINTWKQSILKSKHWEYCLLLLFMVFNATFNNISVIMAVGGFWSFFFNNWHIFFFNPGWYFLPINIEYRRNKNQNISSLKAVIAINVCCFCNIAISNYVERSMVANEDTISN